MPPVIGFVVASALVPLGCRRRSQGSSAPLSAPPQCQISRSSSPGRTKAVTACNVFVRPDAVHIMTDGAISAAEQEVGRMHKPYLMPGSAAVLMATGAVYMTVTVGGLLDCKARDLDEMAELLPEMVRVAETECVKQGCGALNQMEGDFYLAGWSPEQEEFACYFMSTIERPNVPTRTVHYVAGAVSPEIRTPVDLADKTLDPAVAGLAIMREQRRLHAGVVGGFCQLTTVRRDEITTRVLERWM